MLELQISEILESIVNDMTWGETLHFTFGHYQEIANKLTRENRNNQKYPLIGLILDVTEREIDDSEVFKEYDFNMIIAYYTKNNYTSTQRRDLVFKPVLQPLYRELINAIKYSFKFKIVDVIEHTKYDRYLIGSESSDQNKLNDFVDAIEIEFRNMKLINQTNC